MTGLDRFIQNQRIGKAVRHIPRRSRVLDIGCSEGELFQSVTELESGVGIEPLLAGARQTGNVLLLPGRFPQALPTSEPFDAITMLAVLEHVPREEQAGLAADCAASLKPGGRLIVTVPSPAVDGVLAILRSLRLVDGMSLEQHYGFRPEETVQLFERAGLTLVVRQRFQFGLNNLFVFSRRG
jgi:2-polyprenyl-3-methyl-5-hydroxy-6-metoxy-1,4-benzoquinol methylase